MAGIGWRLERLIGRGTLTGAAAAYATGAAVMALPWALTTAVLVLLPLLLGRDAWRFGVAETVVTVAYSVALLVDGPFQVVIARHTADRLYEGRIDAITGPLCRGLGLVALLAAGGAGSILLGLGLPLGSAACGAALAATAGTLWTALSVGNGLSTPAVVLGAVGGGALCGLLLAPASVALLGPGVPGMLGALIAGQALSLAALLAGILRALPESIDERAALLPAFREHAPLAGAGFAFNASLWVDKLLARGLAPDLAEMHAALSTLAWLSTIPCLAWIFVEVETAFHRRFHDFFARLEGGATLAVLHQGVDGLRREVRRLLAGAFEIQAATTLLVEAAAAPCAAWLGMSSEGLLQFRWLALGAGLQALALLGLILLYYFDLRRQAMLAAVALFLGVASGTAAAALAGLPPAAGTATGCAAGTIVVWHLVLRGVGRLLPNTFLHQPFGAEGLSRLP